MIRLPASMFRAVKNSSNCIKNIIFFNHLQPHSTPQSVFWEIPTTWKCIDVAQVVETRDREGGLAGPTYTTNMRWLASMGNAWVATGDGRNHDDRPPCGAPWGGMPGVTTLGPYW